MNKGFSLVELIVVIAIMAILVGVAVPVYTGYIKEANEAKDIQLIDSINHACEIVAIEYTDASFDFNASDDNTFTLTVAHEGARTRLAEILGVTFAENVCTWDLATAFNADDIVCPSDINVD